MSQFPAAPLSPQTVYDAPRTLISMALEGELTARGAKAAFFNPGELTPKEREGLEERLARAAGGGRLARTLAGVASNPLTWLLFLTSPAGVSAVKALGAGGLRTVAPRFMGYMEESGGVLQAMGALTPEQSTHGMAAQVVLGNDISKTVADTVMNTSLILKEPVGSVARSLERVNGLRAGSIRTLDPTDFAVGTKERGVVEKFNYLMGMRMEGMDREVKRHIVTDKGGVAELTSDPVVIPRMVNVDLGGELSKMVGGDSWMKLEREYRGVMKRGIIRLLGKEDPSLGVEQFVADPAKVVAVTRGLRNRALTGESAYAGGADWMRQLGVGDLAEAVSKGEMSPGAFGKVIESALDKLVEAETAYLPRNVREVYVNGRPVSRVQRETARLAQAMSTTQRVSARSRPVADYHPEDWMGMKDAVGGAVTPEFEKKMMQAVTEMAENPRATFLRLNTQEQVERHTRDTSLSWAMHIMPPSADALRLNRASVSVGVKAVPGVEKRLWNPLREGGVGADVEKSLAEQPEMFPLGRPSNADLLYADVARTHNEYTRKLITHWWIPVNMGTYRQDHLVQVAAMMRTKQALRSFAESPIGKGIEKLGETGRAVVGRMKELSEAERGLEKLDGTVDGITQYLYVSHLGLNLGSMLLNMTQPLLLASNTLGWRNVLKGYYRAVGEELKLGEERVALLKSTGSAHMEDVDRLFLYRNTFRHNEALGLGVDAFKAADGVTFGHELGKPKTWLERAADYSMAGFTWAERLNRNVVAHATESLYEGAGLRLGQVEPEAEAAIRGDIRHMVRQTQFGGGRANTAMMFQTSDPALAPSGGITSNPLMRMFMSFAERSAVGQFVEVPKIGKSIRRWGATGIQTNSYGMAVAHDFLRMLGQSAVVYEVGKGLIGADLSRGLGVQAATDVFGARRVERGEGPFPVPPILDIPLQMYKGWVDDDTELWKRQLARLLPGGVALSRAVGVLPSGPDVPDAVALQRQYADWGRAVDGLVPVYKGDGSLVGYEDQTRLVLRGLGADMGAFKDVGDLDGYLLKQRELVTGYRRKAITQLLNGDLDGYGATRAEFQKRVGLPLVISRAQFNEQVKLREVPRVERMLDRLPEDVRPIYARLAAETSPHRFGVDPSAVAEGGTSGRRGPRPNPVQMTPEMARELHRAEVSLPGAQEDDRSFSSFRGFSSP